MHVLTSLPSRRDLIRSGGVLTLAFLAGCATPPPPTPKSDGSDQTNATLAYVNALRKGKGLSPLIRDPAAVAAALAQADRMATNGKMAHLIGRGDSFLDRMKGHGVALPAAENIASGQDTAERAYDAWFRSPKHLVNMLGANYRGLGVAVMKNPASGNRPYWSMVLSSS